MDKYTRSFRCFFRHPHSCKTPHRCKILQSRGHPARWVQDRPRTPNGSNDSPVCFDAHIAFPSGRSSIACHIPFPHIISFHLNIFAFQLFHLMYICQPAWGRWSRQDQRRPRTHCAQRVSDGGQAQARHRTRWWTRRGCTRGGRADNRTSEEGQGRRVIVLVEVSRSEDRRGSMLSCISTCRASFGYAR